MPRCQLRRLIRWNGKIRSGSKGAGGKETVEWTNFFEAGLSYKNLRYEILNGQGYFHN